MTADDWARLRCHVVDQTGWTWDQVGQLPMDALASLTSHWADNPPLRTLVAAIAGVLGITFKTPSKPSVSKQTNKPVAEVSANEMALSQMLGNFARFAG